jgi:hypothetical protein
MYGALAGMVIGAIVGSLLTAYYLSVCHKEETPAETIWIDDAIARAFLYVGLRDTPREG